MGVMTGEWERERFLALRTQHDRKPTLQERFDQAGLPS